MITAKNKFFNKILLIAFLLISFKCCSKDVDTYYEKLNTPLGVRIEVHPDLDGHMVTFYGENRGKIGFKGYAFFEGSSPEASKDKYQEAQAVYLLSVDTNRDVDTPIQIKIGGSVPASGMPHSPQGLTADYYLTIRAIPNYTDGRQDNTDPQKGPTPSYPSNYVLIPSLN